MPGRTSDSVYPNLRSLQRWMFAGLWALLSLGGAMPCTAAEFQSGARSPGRYEVKGSKQDREKLHQSLQSSIKHMNSETTLERAPKTADYERFEAARSECDTCVQSNAMAVGPNLSTGRRVTFKGVDTPAPGTKGAVVAGGLLEPGAGGTVTWTQRIVSPGARALRLHITEMALAPEFELYSHTLAGEVFGPYRDRGPVGDGSFWSNTTMGDEVFLTLRSTGPVSSADLQATRFVVADVAHILDVSAFAAAAEKLASCIQDGSCFDTDDFAGIERLRLAVALMVYAEEGQTFVCSGGLVNDRDEATFLPYFLTANHCIDTEAAAQSLECIWRFQTDECNSGFTDFPDTTGFPRTLGATLLAGRTDSDFTLLQLAEDPPAGSVFLGWTTQRPPGGTTLHRLSHPKGAQQSYSTQVVAASGDRLTCGVLPTAQFLYSTRDIGTTDGGSSGSPVIWERDGSLQIVGQLYGSCFDENAADVCARQGRRHVDGRFETTYAYIARWLDPPMDSGTIPANDNFSDASQLAGTLSQVVGTNVNAIAEPGEPVHAGTGGGKSVWWSWTADGDGTVFISTAGSDFNTVIAVYVGDAVDGLSSVASNDDDGGAASSLVVFSVVRGTTYHIAVDGARGESGAIDLALEFGTALPPDNDAFADAFALAGDSGTATGTNLGAGKESGEPDHAGNAGGRSVWWRWTASGAGQLAVDTLNSPFDTTLAVYTGNSVDQLTTVAANDDAPGTLNSRVSVSVSDGQVYWIAVDGYDGAQGQISLTWKVTGVLENDDFVNARELAGDSGQDSASNVGASSESGEPNHGFNSTNSIWWQWESSSTAEYVFETTGSEFDTVLAIYTGTSPDALVLVAANDDANGTLTSRVSFAARAGTVYRIAVAGYGGAEGRVQLGWQASAALRYTLVLSVSPPDGGSIVASPPADADGRYASGTVVSVEAVANGGYTFSSWSGTGATLANPDTIIMDGDRTRVAIFISRLGAGEAARALLDDFDGTDVNRDGFLNLQEARATVGGVTQALFSELDLDGDGLLARNELESTIDSGGSGGCACPADGKSLAKSLGDLILLLLMVSLARYWSGVYLPN